MRIRTEAAVSKAKTRTSVDVWFQAVRFHYVPPSFLPAILCGMIAWARSGVMDVSAFVLVVFAVTVNHFGLNMLDDVFDYLHFVDRTESQNQNPYTGGSGVITQGLLSVRQVAAGAAICFGTTAAIGFYLAALKGWPVLAFGFFGLLSSIFYTVPPIKFGYRGFGELSMLVNFGPVIGLGAYFVQAGELALEPLTISLVLGCMMWSMITINEIPDYEDDCAGGKMNLVARFGKQKGIAMYAAGLAAAYGILMASVLTGTAPPAALLGLISLPTAYRSIRILRANYHDPIKLTPANLAMINVHFYTGLGMIVGYGLHLL
jgi:1,4-dihydroxy-2-naphthoate octaprenyltransferase